MEVHLKPELEAKLSRVAAQQGRPAENLVEEAVARLVDFEDWFVQETDKGVAAADHGEFADHQGVRRVIDQRYPG